MIHWLFYSPHGFDVLLLLGTLLGTLIYILPSLLSWAAGHARPGLVATNLLLGWTVIFWIVTFVWALRIWLSSADAGEPEPSQSHRRREPRLG
ncbi:MAG: superinfection immunity protein [Acidithiobacillus sp.]|uniref:superinfection immunity protein n=1 Tax=Acidithiobacillus sp. TaxID=1872118 RepID=UPI0025C5AE00|nr:superinfection immunity protein [Acidithiobacillus sp.]